MRPRPDSEIEGVGADMNTMLPQLRDQLLAQQKILQAIADQIKWYVPADPNRDDPINEAYIRAGGASAEAFRAARALWWAMKEKEGE